MIWLVSGGAAFLFAKIVPQGRPPRPWGELAASLTAALLLGLAATALDFGGWREPDWRAAAFAFCGAAALLGTMRAVRLRREEG